MTFRNPPQCNIGSGYRIEPLASFINHLGVRTEERVFPQVFKTFPDGHVVEESRRIKSREVLAKQFQMRQCGFGIWNSPHESPAFFGKPVDFTDPASQPGHYRVVDGAMHPCDVGVCQMVDHIAESSIGCVRVLFESRIQTC